uniref:Uncharacterized protein n=1 Tax=Octactis speculum TaxID=3111310 RepID=A0A7S2HIT6_9STRA
MVVIFLQFLYFKVKRRCLDNSEQIQQLHTSMGFWFLVFTYTIFQSTSSIIFDIFSFDNLGTDNECYLTSDYTTRCNTARWRLWVIYAACCVLVYPIGIPFMYFTLLWRNRHIIDPSLDETGARARMGDNFGKSRVAQALEIRNADRKIQYLAFLFESFEPRYWWWEVFESFRRLTMTSFQVFIFPGSSRQMFTSLAASFLFVKMYSYCNPYVLDSDDILAETVQWVTALTIGIALMLSVGSISSSGFVGAMLIGLQVSVLCFAAYLCLITLNTEINFFLEWPIFKPVKRFHSRVSTMNFQSKDSTAVIYPKDGSFYNPETEPEYDTQDDCPNPGAGMKYIKADCSFEPEKKSS